MNIFALHSKPSIAARYHCDKHVVKMIVESVQLLSNALHSLNLSAPYKKTHFNHPCSIWARTSLQNYQWLWQLADHLGKEYTYRYGKIHKSHQVLQEFIPQLIPLPNIQQTEFANATPYKHLPVIQAYKTYYQQDKASFATWKNRNKPRWFN